MQGKAQISLLGAMSIGIGGMIGAGIFSILGVVAMAAGAAMWISFLIGGVIALFCTYSYAKLGARFPTAGGAVQFLIEGFGKGKISSSINLFMWVGYILSIALYAQGFSAYAMAMFGITSTPLRMKLIASAIVIFFTAINILGAKSVGKMELLIVSIKVAILILFTVVGIFFIQPDNLSPAHWRSLENIFFGAGVLFIGYEGFGLITNAAADMYNPQVNLPKALYASVILVMIIYVLVSITVTGNLSTNEILTAGDYALAEAAKPFLGSVGFKLMAIAALFSTASAINATLFGSANVCYMIARDGELPEAFERTEWRNATGGLFITTLLTLIFILFFDLSSVAMMGSGAFLLIYAAVNAGHLNILQQTGAKKSLVVISFLLCLILFAILEIYTFNQSPSGVYTMILLLLACIAFAACYKRSSP